MVTTPVCHTNIIDGDKYRGFALSQLNILRQQMQLGRLNIGQRSVKLDNGIIIYCTICYNKEDVYISYPKSSNDGSKISLLQAIKCSGVIFYPRSSDIKEIQYKIWICPDPVLGWIPVNRQSSGMYGGWKNGVDLLKTGYVYPTNDSDNASFVYGFYKEGDKAVNKYGLVIENKTNSGSPVSRNIKNYGFTKASGKYGNLYWISSLTSENPIVLSYKGTPTRHIRIPVHYDIPSLTYLFAKRVGATSEEPLFTTFSSNIYIGGLLWKKAPRFNWSNVDGNDRCLVLGIAREPKTKAIYVVMQSYRDKNKTPKTMWQLMDDTIWTDESKMKDYIEKNRLFKNVSIAVTKTITSPGVFITLWKSPRTLYNEKTLLTTSRKLYVDGWELVGDFPYTDVGLPWFGNVSGTCFACSNGDVINTAGVINTETGVAYTDNTLTQRLDKGTDAKYTNTIDFSAGRVGNYGTKKFYSADVSGGKWTDYYEYKGDDINYSVITLSHNSVTNLTNTENTYEYYPPPYPSYRELPVNLNTGEVEI